MAKPNTAATEPNTESQNTAAGTTTATAPAPQVQKAPWELIDGKKVVTEHTSRSAQVRYLATQLRKSDGKPDIGAITKVLNAAGQKSKNGNPVLYQHVRNILSQPLKTGAAA